MDIELLARRLADLGVNHSAYRVGSYGGGSSDSVLLERTTEGFEVSYLERGNKSVMARFASEAEACEYVLRELTRDESALAHNVGVFDSESQAGVLVSKLKAAGIRVKTDAVPVVGGKRYRVFVFGRDLERVRQVRGW